MYEGRGDRGYKHEELKQFLTCVFMDVPYANMLQLQFTPLVSYGGGRYIVQAGHVPHNIGGF